MNKNLILFLVLAAAAAIAYFILSAPTEQQAAATGGNAGGTSGGGTTGPLSDPAVTFGAATGGNALDGLLSALTTTPNPGIASDVILVGQLSPNIQGVGKIKLYGLKSDPSNILYMILENGQKLLPEQEEFKRLLQAIRSQGKIVLTKV